VKNSVFNRKEFNLNLLNFDTLPRVEVDGVRHYTNGTEDFKYPSVTTVLDKMTDKTHLIEWRKRVGEQEANRVSKFATTRGTAVHTMAENYVLGEDVDLSMPGNKIIFDQIKKVLDSNVDNVIASESTLISHKLKVAGTTDLIAEYDGKLSIIDYKTASKRKRKEWIENYFLQSALYSYMLWEMTGIMAKQIVIIIGIDSEPEAQVFKVNPSDYIEKAAQMCRDYHDVPR
jgi:hypothetical protein